MRYLMIVPVVLLLTSCGCLHSNSGAPDTAPSASPSSEASASAKFKVGGFYTIRTDPGRGLVKMLAVQKSYVFVRIYANKNPSEWISLGANPEELRPLSKCMRLTNQNFIDWEPELKLEQPLTDEELQSYHEYKEKWGF